MALYDVPGLPEGEPQEINLADLGNILKIIVKYPNIRSDMFADPQQTLAKLNYTAHGDAVQFFASLRGADFHAASEAFAPAHPDPALGMAEC